MTNPKPLAARLPSAPKNSIDPSHISAEMFKIAAGVDLVHVPYKGIAPALPDLLVGRTHVMFSNTSTFITHIRSGKLRALAIADAQRTALLPDLPTTAEAGLPGFEISAWFGSQVVKQAGVKID